MNNGDSVFGSCTLRLERASWPEGMYRNLQAGESRNEEEEVKRKGGKDPRHVQYELQHVVRSLSMVNFPAEAPHVVGDLPAFEGELHGELSFHQLLFVRRSIVWG